jgi:ParB family chromosome partitioning protein
MQTKLIDINKIIANKNQPRINFNESSLNELAESIEENGLIQPITVRIIKDHYEIIAGERRYRACKKMNYQTIMANIMYKNDLESAKLALTENIQRENLTAVEEAKAYAKILKESNITQVDLARQLGKSQSAIANKIRLLNLPEVIKDAVSSSQITERHARALLKLSKEQQDKVFNKMIEDKLNVLQTENLVKKMLEPKKVKKKTRGFSKNIKIGVNTINQAIAMCEKVGLDVTSEQSESDDELSIIIRFTK